jgi:predicted permease
MNDELRAHLEGLIERNVAAGMSPDEARHAALRVFGGVEQIKERARDERRSVWGEQVLQDLRYAVRQLRKTPAFTAVVVLSLALGIGANTAVFSRINDRLLKMLPVRSPGELVLFQWLPSQQGGGPPSDGGDSGNDNIDRETGRRTRRLFSLRTYEVFRDDHAVLSEVFAVAPVWALNIRIDGETEVVGNAQLVSGNYYTGLGVSAFHGRTLSVEDDRADAALVAMISYRYWQTRFGADLAAIGKTIMVNRTPVVIVGITPPEFRDTISGGAVDLTMPLGSAPAIRSDGKEITNPGHWWLHILGRLRPGITLQQVRVALGNRFIASAREGIPKINDDDLPRLRAVSGGYSSTEADRQQEAGPLKIELGITALVLFAACVNVANLLLARGAVRRRELAVRLALGASRGRIIRQLLTESVLLAALGAALSTGFAFWGLDLLSVLSPAGDAPALDWRVLGFTSGIAILTSIGFGLVPALQATRFDVSSEFQGGTRQLWGDRSRLGRTLLVLQMAVSLVLLVGAGLFVRTVRNLRHVDVGFNRSNLLLFGFNPTLAGYERAQLPNLFARVAERIATVPGARGVTFSSWPILSNSSGFILTLPIPGYTPPSGQDDAVTFQPIAANYFETYQIPLLAGRSFGSQDGATTPRVAIVNQAFVRKYFTDANPVGRRVGRGSSEKEIVGVVSDVKQRDLRTAAVPTLYVPFTQNIGRSGVFTFAVRTAGEPARMGSAIRAAVREVEDNVPLTRLRTQDEIVENVLLENERFFARMSGFLGALALALACVGLYGLLSYSVLRRTGEIGLRMALGAESASVLRMILRESLTLVAIGVIVGIGLSFIASRLVASVLFGLSLSDPLTYTAVALMLVLVASLASWWPARRAAKMDPMVALRCE